MLYLKNLLKNDPENEFLMYTLAEQSLRSGKKDLSFRLLGLLLKSKDEDMRIKSYYLSYQLAKEDYFYLIDKQKKLKADEKYRELQVFFNEIISQKFYPKDNLMELYKEAIFLKDTKNSYKIIKLLIYQDKSNVELVEDAYHISIKLKQFKDSIYYIDKLVDLDKKNTHKWNELKYYLIVKHYSFEKAEKLLKLYAQDSLFWKDKLGSFYLQNKKYILASKSYMKLFKSAQSQEEKIKLWKKAITYLNYGKYTQRAVDLAYKYEKYFYKNKGARIFLLRLYLSLGKLTRASNLSKRILRDKQ